ncbi:MAG: HU family DNA-binding protein [Rhodanobacter sp.]
MTKAAVASRLTEHLGLTKAQALNAVDLVLDGIERVVLSTGRVTFVGFGAFVVEEREGKPPKVGFTPSKDFLHRLAEHVRERDASRAPRPKPAANKSVPKPATAKRGSGRSTG